jgi:hypothetical protein
MAPDSLENVGKKSYARKRKKKKENKNCCTESIKLLVEEPQIRLPPLHFLANIFYGKPIIQRLTKKRQFPRPLGVRHFRKSASLSPYLSLSFSLSLWSTYKHTITTPSFPLPLFLTPGCVSGESTHIPSLPPCLLYIIFLDLALQMSSASGNFVANKDTVLKEGYFKKRNFKGELGHAYSRRWCVLTSRYFEWFDHPVRPHFAQIWSNYS